MDFACYRVFRMVDSLARDQELADSHSSLISTLCTPVRFDGRVHCLCRSEGNVFGRAQFWTYYRHIPHFWKLFSSSVSRFCSLCCNPHRQCHVVSVRANIKVAVTSATPRATKGVDKRERKPISCQVQISSRAPAQEFVEEEWIAWRALRTAALDRNSVPISCMEMLFPSPGF